jgi:peptidoglycan hydrolase-like protein with peptidoglycan-binding domain
METLRARPAGSATRTDWLGETDRRSPAYVGWVQESLNRVAGAGLTVDGRLGPRTRGAVQAFQGRHGLVADGVVGPRTEAALVAAGAPAPPGAGSSTPVVPRPSPAPAPHLSGARACPEPARLAVDRCRQSQPCPAIPDLLCQQSIDGVPFEYPTSVGRDPGTGLRIVTARQSPRTQRFVPSVRASLPQVVRDLRRFGLPIEAILTLGSVNCRCMYNNKQKTNTLSNHSFGDAIDIAGVRWSAAGGPASRLRETIVDNYADPAERALLRRINACLRLSFATVIDYHRADHRDHFHCDTNQGRGRRPRGVTTTVFTQEALSHVLGRSIKVTGRFDAETERALSEFSGRAAGELRDDRVLNQVLTGLYARIAAGR